MNDEPFDSSKILKSLTVHTSSFILHRSIYQDDLVTPGNLPSRAIKRKV
jgi:hypothetical protein